jgi:hypothetical protein
MTRTRAGLDRQLPSRASTNQTGPAWMLAAFQRGLSSPPEMPRALYAPHFSSSEPGAARGVVALAAELPVRPLAVDCSTDGTAIAIAATAAALPAPTRRRVQTPPLPRSGEQIPRRVLGRGQHRCPHAAAGCEAACNVTGMAGAAGMSDWRGMELGAPEIARLGTARSSAAAARVAMLGTLRQDGSPRISPIEPYIVNGRLLVGAMKWPAKAADLRRDPRYVLHSIVTGPDNGEGELELYGTAAEADSGLRGAAAEAWWPAQRPDTAIVYVLLIEQALFVAWDIERGMMAVHRWSPRDGYSHTTRTYP